MINARSKITSTPNINNKNSLEQIGEGRGEHNRNKSNFILLKNAVVDKLLRWSRTDECNLKADTNRSERSRDQFDRWRQLPVDLMIRVSNLLR